MNRKSFSPMIATRLPLLLCLAAALASPAPGFAANKDMIQLQTQVQQLQDAVARLQQSNDERMGVLKDLVQQSSDSVNKMSISIEALQKQMQTQQDAQNGKLDQVSGQIQAMNDSLDELKTRLARLEKLTQDVQNQQQSMSANMQPVTIPAAGGAAAAPAPGQPLGAAPTESQPASSSPAPAPAQPELVPPPGSRKGKPQAGIPATPPTSGPAAPPADELYKTALGDYMAAKYTLASSEFGDVVKYYPENPLAGNAAYYQGEIDYRAGHYSAAVKNYDKVIEQYPDSSKVPVSHLHKAQALISLKQNEAGIREYRALIQRFPNSPEATQARSKLNGMGVAIVPRQR